MKKLSSRSMTAIAVVLVLAVGGLVFALGGNDDGGSDHAAIGATPTGPTATTVTPATAPRAGDIIPGEYIVTLKPGAAALQSLVTSLLAAVDGLLQQTFTKVLRGFSAKLTAHAAALLRANPAVAAVEPNRVVTASSDTGGTLLQQGAPWGIARISAPRAVATGSYTQYAYGSNQTGAGVNAYILDTGIYTAHQDFGGRAVWGYTDPDLGYTKVDGNGHGTHIAGTVGGTVYGVAKKVTLVAVKVLDDSGGGSQSGVIAGMDWVAEKAAQNRSIPSVVNLSLEGGRSVSVDHAVSYLVDSGVTVVGSAGNDGADACSYSPAAAPEMITVAAADNRDIKAPFSNSGSCVDLVAPGVNIKSAWTGTRSATNIISGASMAVAHVTGLAARYLSLHPTATPAQVTNAIISKAQVGVVQGLLAGTPNRLLHLEGAGFQ